MSNVYITTPAEQTLYRVHEQLYTWTFILTYVKRRVFRRCKTQNASTLCGILYFLGRTAAMAIDAAYCYSRSSVVCLCVCVCLLVTFASPAKTGDGIEMPFGCVTRLRPRWGPDCPREGTILAVVRPVEKRHESVLRCTLFFVMTPCDRL